MLARKDPELAKTYGFDSDGADPVVAEKAAS